MDIKVVLREIILLSLFLDSAFGELLQVHAIFRHGEKTADSFLMFPTDPYINHTFLPYGPGQLTNEGKKTAYDLGKTLKKRYSKFLGDAYLPSLVHSWSTSFDRCQCSLQLVLAAMFPPEDPLIWNKDLNWQPIAYNFLPQQHDDMFTSVVQEDFIEEYYRYALLGEGKKVIEENRSILSYIEAHSNKTITSLRDMMILHIVLSAEEANGLPLPEWTKKIYPQPLGDLTLLEYKSHLATKYLRRRIVGKWMKLMLDYSENRIKHKSNYKLHLYSLHDLNLVHALVYLGLMYDHHPGFAACLLIELHEENKGHFLQVYYRDDKRSNFELLRFPNGEKRLYLHRFREMVDDLFEEDREINSGASKSFNIHPTNLFFVIGLIFAYHLN